MNRFLLLLLAFLTPIAAARAQPYPSPTYNNVTIGGNANVAGNFGVGGTASLIGGGTLSGNFGGSSKIRGMTAGLQNVSTAGLSTLTGMLAGDTVWVTDCQTGAQTFPGTGCSANYNGIAWVTNPSPPSLKITIGGQAIALGGSTQNMGNGSLIQTANGSQGVSGNCPQYNSGGALVDSGAPCGGGSGGSGTNTPGPQNAIPAYSGAGTSTILAALGIVNNAVLVTNGSGQPLESATMPIGLTIPNATISNASMTGTTNIASASYTGKQTFIAGTINNASINIPAGVAPTSPVGGDEWGTASGLFYRAGSTSQGPFLYQVSTTSPLGGGGTGPSLTLTCTQCALTTNGGLLTATGPMAISSSGVISLGGTTAPLSWIADSAFVVHNDTYPLIEQWPWTNTGTVNKMIFHTGGITSPSFVATLQICTGGPSGTCTNVTGCTSISVSSTTDGAASCSAANTVASNQTLAMVITGTTGSPASAVVQLNITKPAS